VSAEIAHWVFKEQDKHTDVKGSLGFKFVGGLLSGAICGLATQVFHNAALTAGRMVASGFQPTNVECMRLLFAERGIQAFYFNFPMRVCIIAFWSGVLTVTRPFD
jgi:hypothetical protein